MRVGDHERCERLSWVSIVTLVLAGCGLDAYAQEPTALQVTDAGSVGFWADPVGRGGIPMALVYLSWQARGWATQLTITVELSEKTIERIAETVRKRP